MNPVTCHKHPSVYGILLAWVSPEGLNLEQELNVSYLIYTAWLGLVQVGLQTSFFIRL